MTQDCLCCFVALGTESSQGAEAAKNAPGNCLRTASSFANRLAFCEPLSRASEGFILNDNNNPDFASCRHGFFEYRSLYEQSRSVHRLSWRLLQRIYQWELLCIVWSRTWSELRA